MTDVFISYARPTARQAEAAAEALRVRGYEVWLDQELPAHGSFADVIETRIGEAKAVLVLWSEPARQSDWVRSEANRAREQHKLVQISLDAVAPPMPFEQLQCIPLIGWPREANDAAWLKVMDSVAKLAGPPGPGAVPARRPHAHSPARPTAVVSADGVAAGARYAPAGGHGVRQPVRRQRDGLFFRRGRGGDPADSVPLPRPAR